ncbi:MAG: hypothetical protein IMF07_03845 [Proteobacteria bacterium]|nr:hypothetical protein [Pseudomonadota bacterium]
MRFLFKLVDYILAVFMGVASVWLVSLVVGSGWNMFIAMFVGMFLGMLAVFPALLFSCGVTTAFHVLPVGMLITMFTGMIAGMAIAMGALSTSQLYPLAIFIAATVQLAIDRYDMKLKGEVPLGRT